MGLVGDAVRTQSQVEATVVMILRPFNPRVVGSSPTGPTVFPLVSWLFGAGR
jgi:hypothetical protein